MKISWKSVKLKTRRKMHTNFNERKLFYRKINKIDKHQFEQSKTQKEKTGSIQIIKMRSKENTL